MRTMTKIIGAATALAFMGAIAAPAQAREHGYSGGHAWRGGWHGYHHGHAWHGHRGYAIGGARYYAPYYDRGYAYGYPYRYGYYDYDPGAAFALSAIGSIASLIGHNAFRHGHYRHHYHHRHR